ncbi:MAG TPA: hypothetical protein DD413_09210 [Ruminococcus sp.]|nr:hypothetical protein [Ruminococcus sp.]
MSFSKIVKCETCKHFILNDKPPFATCKAYPTGIPTRIFSEEVNHDRHRPFDKGYRYEPKEN